MAWEPADGILAASNSVTTGFFRSLDLRVAAGRDFSWSDHARSPRVTVLSRALAQLFPDRDPLGQRIRIGTQPYRQDLEVVGIVADARVYDVKDASSYSAYVAELQNSEPVSGGWLIIRGQPDESALQKAVQSVGPDFIRDIGAARDAFAEAITTDRITAVLAGLFGVLTLGLAAVGVGGLLAYTVVLRTKEMAIRLALSAEPRRIVKSMVIEGLLIALAGTALGIGVSVVFTSPVRALLFGIDRYDPVVLFGVPMVLAAVAVCACIIPALRAASVDPIIALRVE
jgi:ABC-type antimicrobial peptide transport system permease subunit